MNNLSVEKNNFYSIEDAIKQIKKNSKTKFISSIDIAVKLNVDTTKSDQQLRGTLSLPYFFGKKKRILVIDSGLTSNDAKKLGVDYTGDKEIIDKIAGGWIDFDLIITTPKMMPLLSKLGKILGTKGLMPNPKNGNVTTDLNKTIKDFQSGISQYKTDTYGNIHMVIGKTDAEDKKIIDNINFLLEFLKNKKPLSVKNQFIENVYLSSTMGESFKIGLTKSQDNKNNSNKTKNKHINKKQLSSRHEFKPIIKTIYVKKNDENTLLEKNIANKNNFKKLSKDVVNKKSNIDTNSKKVKDVKSKKIVEKKENKKVIKKIV